jgi:hypothetical protein
MVAAGLPPLAALGSGRHPNDDGVNWRSSGARRWRSVGGPCNDGSRRAPPLPPCFFSSGRTEPMFLAVTMAAVVVVALDPWLPRVDLSPSWSDPSPGLWACCEAARGRLRVGASLGGHGASAAPSSLPPPLRQRRRPWHGGRSRRVCCRLWRRG